MGANAVVKQKAEAQKFIIAARKFKLRRYSPEFLNGVE